MIELSQVDGSKPIEGSQTVSSETVMKGSKQGIFMGRALKVIIAATCVAAVATFASMNRKDGSSNTAGLDSMTPGATVSKNIHEDLHFDLRTLEPLKFHQSGFGALNFHHHESGTDKYRRFLSSSEIKIPVSAVEHAIPSLGEKNILNLAGHYVHDETRSPWSALNYNRPKEELMQEQKEFLEKMHKVREEWGSWEFKDHAEIVRPVQNFSKIKYKDIKNSKWQKNVWQTDEKYVKDFIKEGRKLIDRMTEGIYAEFGFPTKKADGSTMSAEELTDRARKFEFTITEDLDPKTNQIDHGFGYLRQAALDGLARKLLHAMITNDEFYYVLGGHSAAAGHGNDHAQQKTMQFNNIMEPVFQKLGIRLIARNLAMGGYGTMHFSAGQSELYGEKDFLEWDSSMTEKKKEAIDLFNKQGLMNGERVPIIFSRYFNDIVDETDGKAWVGNFNNVLKDLPETTSEEQGRTLPWLVQFQNCFDGVSLCGGRDMIDKYDAYCWVDRNDVPEVDPNHGRPPLISRRPGGQASWHPGWRGHRIASRKSAMLFMVAFKQAFDIWEKGIKTDGFPLAEKYWHVGDVYEDIRDSLHKNINGERKGKSVCETKFKEHGVDAWCRVSMHGMSTFRPINLGNGNDILKNLKAAPSGYVPKNQYQLLYTGPDLLPLSWKVPEGHVDLHAIAIATSYEAPMNEHLFDDTDDDAVEDAELGRMLRASNNEELDHSQSENESYRSLSSSDIVPGEGWGLDKNASEDEYCDGSPQAECGRDNANAPYFSCLLDGDNDRRNTLSGDGLSGWLLMTIPGEIKNGIIWAKFEWWHPRDTWYLTPLDDNNRMLSDEIGSRNLGGAKPYPDDMKLDIAVNGKIYDTWDKEKFMLDSKELSYNEAFYKLITNDTSVNGKNVEFGLRIRSESDPKGAGLGIAHIYWS